MGKDREKVIKLIKLFTRKKRKQMEEKENWKFLVRGIFLKNFNFLEENEYFKFIKNFKI
jgi:hypothetical protein